MAQPTFKKIEGEPYLYEATYPSGTKKYVIRGSRTGVPGKKQYFPFTFTGLKTAKRERDEWVKKTDKIIQDKIKKQGALDPAVKKVANPPDPKKPWRYKKSGSTRGDGKAKASIEYFASEKEALAAQADAKKAKYDANTKIPKGDLQKIKNKIIAGDTLEEIAETYKSSTRPIAKLLRDNNTSYSALTPNISYLEDAESLKYVKENYGKLKGETMSKKLYPDLPASTQESRVRKLVSKLINEKTIKAIPAALIEEYREEKGFNPEESAKKVQEIRKKKIKKFSVPAFERAMEGSTTSQLSHMDDLGSQIVKFETLGYSPQRINQEILKNVDPYLNQLYKERDKLFKNKSKGYVNKINKINDKGAAVAYATKGYKSFKVEEPITRNTYRLGLDPSKTVDPFGLFEGKSIQEVSPKNFRGNIKAIDKIIPDPIDRYFFMENAKAVQEAQANIPKSEITKVSQNLKQLDFDTDPYKLFSDIREDAAANGPICKIVRTKKANGGTISCVDAVEEAIQKEPEKLAQDASRLDKFKNSATKFLQSPLTRGAGKFGALAAVGAAATGAVKTFMNDDPTTYLSNEEQQKNLLIDMVTGSLDDTPQERPAILDYQLPVIGAGAVAGTAAVAPSTIEAARSGALGAKKSGITKTALKTLGRGLSALGTPAALLATEPLFIAGQVQQGDSLTDIATNPMNYLGAAFAGPATEFATKGLSPTIAKTMRLGISPSVLKTVSRRFGLPGLALSAGISGYEMFDDYRNKRGMFREE